MDLFDLVLNCTVQIESVLLSVDVFILYCLVSIDSIPFVLYCSTLICSIRFCSVLFGVDVFFPLLIFTDRR